MRIKFLVSLMSLFLMGLMACSKVPAGNVGIKVYLLGQDDLNFSKYKSAIVSFEKIKILSKSFV